MLDHTSISVKDYKQSLDFYDKTFATLGYDRVLTFEVPQGNFAGYGDKGRIRPSFWISSEGNPSEDIGNARGLHLCFQAPTLEAIQAWYDTCLELGGTCNGKPGPRPEYHPGYYGAFIIDPSGWRIEACLHHYSEA